MSASERIKLRREELGLTQEELAHKLGYKSRSSVNKIETSRDLPMKKVKQFAKALDCTPAYLMGWEDESENIVDYLYIDKDMELLIETYQKSDVTTQDIIKKILGLK